MTHFQDKDRNYRARIAEQIDWRITQCCATTILGHAVAAHDLGDLMLRDADKVELVGDRSVIGIARIAGSAVEAYPAVDTRAFAARNPRVLAPASDMRKARPPVGSVTPKVDIA
jgi:hypothetical protein